MDGWEGVKDVLRICYSNQQKTARVQYRFKCKSTVHTGVNSRCPKSELFNSWILKGH